MPIVAYNNQPSLERISKEGLEVISIESAKHQDIRDLHFGFLNMMPDAAFLATERQFFRLIGSSNKIVQIYVHPIKLEGVKRNTEITKHIDQYYESFDSIKSEGLDGLIVTGANPTLKNITEEDYWQHANEIFQWAETNVSSVFFSCLASHAILQANYNIYREPLTKKLWGVYPHRVKKLSHPLVANINTKFDMPHSRGNDISQADFIKHNLNILVTGYDTGVALATSSDGIHKIFCQGHPEYDIFSLLKEYKREIELFITGERSDYPPFPNNYFSEEGMALLNEFKNNILNRNSTLSDFPDTEILNCIDNTWLDTAKSIFSNWIGIVYRITNVDRTKQFMAGINPENPLQIFKSKQ